MTDKLFYTVKEKKRGEKNKVGKLKVFWGRGCIRLKEGNGAVMVQLFFVEYATCCGGNPKVLCPSKHSSFRMCQALFSSEPQGQSLKRQL